MLTRYNKHLIINYKIVTWDILPLDKDHKKATN
jgi:hypothetical protein